VHAQVVNILRVTPQVYWQKLFFDGEYHQALYDRLAFPSCKVELLETDAQGRTRRVLRAVPPLHAPEFIQRQLAGKLFYIEDGTYDPATGLWTFKNEVSVAAESVKISGVIHTEPCPEGLRHVLNLEAKVNVFGLGSLFEHLIEKNTRDSYAVMREFTNQFAAQKGLRAG
jgi:Protein of unknown function (DUF2505)